MWPELGSNPEQWDDEQLRALKISVLNHSAMGAAMKRSPWTAIIKDYNTVKILKFRTPEKFAVITLKFEQGGFIIE